MMHLPAWVDSYFVLRLGVLLYAIGLHILAVPTGLLLLRAYIQRSPRRLGNIRHNGPARTVARR
jgi:hypothetical protein